MHLELKTWSLQTRKFICDLPRNVCLSSLFLCGNGYRCLTFGPTFVVKDKWTASFLGFGKHELFLFRDS